MARFIASLASAMTANRFSQSLLLRGARGAEYLMGVGAGSSVADSGECSVLERLKHSGQEAVIFDVGANKGQFLRMAAEAMGTVPRQFHCFEPSAVAWNCLRENARGMPGVTLSNIGLGRETGTRILYADHPGSGLASLTKRRLDHFGVRFRTEETVTVDTVDNYCRSRGIGQIDLLKLDVEGHEMDVLLGAAEMFRGKAIRFVTFEFGGCNIDTRSFVQDFFYFFGEQSMRIARITPSGFWFELDTYREIHEQFRATNFVAFRIDP